ncbi:hypothetical protein EFP34_10920 [Lacticaseibacillus paracasei]|nr:hypothetical protein [Lacticaseibacillus paracasei]VTZ83738.1 hypothetical protein LPCP272_01699 [Lacticaseibacillus paracasei]
MAKAQPFKLEATYAPVSNRACSRSNTNRRILPFPSRAVYHTDALRLCELTVGTVEFPTFVKTDAGNAYVIGSLLETGFTSLAVVRLDAIF